MGNETLRFLKDVITTQRHTPTLVFMLLTTVTTMQTCFVYISAEQLPHDVFVNEYHTTSAKNISVRAEWLRQSGRAPSEPLETPQWRIAPHSASIPRVALHIALRSLFYCFFSLCQSHILNDHSGVEGPL